LGCRRSGVLPKARMEGLSGIFGLCNGCEVIVTLAAGRPGASQLGTSQLDRLGQMATKNRRLAGNSKFGDDGAVTSLGNPYRRVRVGR
jgi:hypothetical protein